MEWNDERIAALARLWKDGFSAAQVALQLGGVSRSAVIGKIHRLGIAGRDAPSRPRRISARPTAVARTTSHGGRRSPAAQAPRRPMAPREAFEAPATATLTTLTEQSCRWPIGDPSDESFGFCGRLRTGKGAYCQGHAPMSLGRRTAPIAAKQIDRLVSRFGDAQRADPRSASYL